MTITGRRVGMTLAFVLLAATTSPTPALAWGDLSAKIVPQPTAPIKINGCYGYLSDLAGEANYYVNLSVDFTNTGSYEGKTAVAVRIRYLLADAFDGVIAVLQGDRTGTFSPGAYIMQPRQWYEVTHHYPVPLLQTLNTYDNVAEVFCAVKTVRFSDGSIWEATK